MNRKTFHFKSIGISHSNEVDFFKFLVNQHFNNLGSKLIQWCKFDGLYIIVESIEVDIINMFDNELGQTIQTDTGYIYKKTN
jgi:hypothetical protein